MMLPAADDGAPPRARGDRSSRRSRTEGQTLLGWRDVPVDSDVPGRRAPPAVEPRDPPGLRRLHARRRPPRARLRAQALRDPPRDRARARARTSRSRSFSSRTIVYKGMLTSPQLPRYFPDLRDERMNTALALVHSRFSTNTFPSWELAHPYRMICPQRRDQHGARQHQLDARARVAAALATLFGDDLEQAHPGRPARAARTRRPSTTCSSCSCSAAARCRTR